MHKKIFLFFLPFLSYFFFFFIFASLTHGVVLSMFLSPAPPSVISNKVLVHLSLSLVLSPSSRPTNTPEDNTEPSHIDPAMVSLQIMTGNESIPIYMNLSPNHPTLHKT